uniref:hypothetical protein n=1 Tax=Micrococcus luteus TaxID=1270 RepID=UPI0030169743
FESAVEGSLEGSHGDRVREGDGVGDRGGLHHYQGLNSEERSLTQGTAGWAGLGTSNTEGAAR